MRVALKLPVNPAAATVLDSTENKFTRITDSALLDLCKSKRLNIFGILATLVSGLARERNSSGDICTTGERASAHNVHHCCSEQEFHYTNRRIATHTKDREFYKIIVRLFMVLMPIGLMVPPVQRFLSVQRMMEQILLKLLI